MNAVDKGRCVVDLNDNKKGPAFLQTLDLVWWREEDLNL